MARKALATILIFVFFSLQYGKIATYYFCKWQAEQQQLKNCGCETHLQEMYADAGVHNTPINLNKTLFSDFILDSWVTINCQSFTYQSVYKLYPDNWMTDPPIESALRPPIYNV